MGEYNSRGDLTIMTENDSDADDKTELMTKQNQERIRGKRWWI